MYLPRVLCSQPCGPLGQLGHPGASDAGLLRSALTPEELGRVDKS